MPYIKKKKRPQFDKPISLLEDGKVLVGTNAILDAIKTVEESALEGCLNYIFTQALRKCKDIMWAESAILSIIMNVYMMPCKYDKLEKILGKLRAMQIEFKRRKWREEALISLKRLERFVEQVYIVHENKKIGENGDLE